MSAKMAELYTNMWSRCGDHTHMYIKQARELLTIMGAIKP